MTNSAIIQVMDSWELTTVGIVVELRHHRNGLHSGLIIESPSTGEKWRVKYRILFSHTCEKQKIFAIETTTISFISFDSVENQMISAKNVLDKEDDNIFQYKVEAIGHKSKPIKGDILV